MKRMMKILPILAALPGLFLFLQVAPALAAPIGLEILYLPHQPAMVVVDKVEQIAAGYNNVVVKKYSFDDRDTQKLVKKYKITDHMPVVVFINGQDSFTVAGRTMRLRNFPKGDAFVPMFAGEWDYADLQAILADLAGAK